MIGVVEIEFFDDVPEREARDFTTAVAHYAFGFAQVAGTGADLKKDEPGLEARLGEE